MAHNKKFADYQAAISAVDPIATTSGALTGNKINAAGADRVRFLFNFGAGLTDAKLSSGCGIWQASTSGATFARAGASFGEISTGAGNGKVAVLDVNVNPSYPWLLVSGQLTSSFWPLSVVAVLDGYANRPPTALTQQIVAND